MIQTTIEVRTASWLEGARPLDQRRGCGSDWGMAGKIRENDVGKCTFWCLQKRVGTQIGTPFRAPKFTENLLLAQMKSKRTQKSHVAFDRFQKSQAAALSTKQGRRRCQTSAQAEITSGYSFRISFH